MVSTHKKAHKLDVLDGKTMDQAVAPFEPTFEAIRTRAYEVYVQWGWWIDGFDLENWLQAQKELRESGNKQTT